MSVLAIPSHSTSLQQQHAINKTYSNATTKRTYAFSMKYEASKEH
jgi:hypothetical protein